MAGLAGITFPKLTGPEWLRLFQFVSTIDSSGKTGRQAGLQRVSVAIANSRRAAALLQQWPRGFHNLLERRQNAATPSFSLQRTFGRLYRSLYVDLDSPSFQFMRDAFENYLEVHWRGLVCGRNRRIKTDRGHRHTSTSIQALAKSLGVSPTLVRRLCESGQFSSTAVALPSGRRAWSIPNGEAAKISTVVNDGINLSDAAAHLKLPRRRIRELVDAGFVIPAIRAGTGRAAAWLFSLRQITALVSGCATRAVPADSFANDDAVPISTVLKTWRLGRDEFPALLHAIQRGEIKCVVSNADDTSLGGFLLNRASARRWHRAWQAKSGAHLSVDGAARLLGIKQQVAYHLVKRKALDSEVLMQTSNVRRIPSAAIDNFRETYVSLVQLARKQGRSPKAVLESSTIRPVIGPTIDGCRQYFFLRADLAKSDSWC
ncbi:hypothetical protein [Paraburkholderia sp. BR14320]|uniref:hypothetical protein n=1 Tax=unclassified Paraburkholderia TaxID=2615204 RepID=UPI0034CD867F